MDAETYIDLWEKHKVWTHLEWPKHQERFRMIASFLRGEALADISCAFGHSTNYLKAMKGGKWTGVDFSAKAVDKAKENFPDIDFLYLAGIEHLKDLPQFDGVVCSEVIEHIEDDKTLIDGLISITKKTLVITTPCKRVSSVGDLRVYNEKMLSALFGEYPNVEYRKKDPFYYVVIKK